MNITIGDIDVTYTEKGAGEPVVLVHGLAEDSKSFENIQAKLSGFRTYAYDIRGHGKTTLGDANGSLEQLGQDLIGFLDHVSGPAKCVGYSLGGTIVLSAVLQRPELVKRATIVATSAVVGRAAAEFFDQRINLIKADKAAFDKALTEDTKAQICGSDLDILEIVTRRIKAVGSGGGYINAARAMIGVREKPLTPRLSEIKCPVDIIGADKDSFCPRKAADIMLEGLTHGTYREIEDCGHLISIDQPVAYSDQLSDCLG